MIRQDNLQNFDKWEEVLAIKKSLQKKEATFVRNELVPIPFYVFGMQEMVRF